MLKFKEITRGEKNTKIGGEGRVFFCQNSINYYFYSQVDYFILI
jgi:hypothetical protein